MKKTKKYIFLTLILLLLTSCVLKKNTQNNTSNEPNLIKITEDYSKELSDGSYKKNNFFKNFNTESQGSIDKKELYQSIDHYRTIVGDFKSIEKVQLTEQSVLLVLDNEHRKSSEVYTYDNTGKLTNISTFPGSVKKESNKYYSIKPIELYKDNLIIPGALTMPKDIENPPIVIMITGLGPYDMDETIGLSGNQPFKDIAIGLAKNNIASLRYDKSILHGNLKNSIENEYFNDFDAAYNFVKSLNNVDLENIYILAHDQGAMLAPTMAKEITGLTFFFFKALYRYPDKKPIKNLGKTDTSGFQNINEIATGAIIFCTRENIPKISPTVPPTIGPPTIAPIIVGICNVVILITPRGSIPKGVSPSKIDRPDNIPIVVISLVSNFFIIFSLNQFTSIYV